MSILFTNKIFSNTEKEIALKIEIFWCKIIQSQDKVTATLSECLFGIIMNCSYIMT